MTFAADAIPTPSSPPPSSPDSASRYGHACRRPERCQLFGLSVGRRAWFASRMTAQASATGPTCPSLSGFDHRSDRLDPPVEYVERQGAEDLAVPVVEDRARLAVHLVRLHYDADLDEPGECRGKYPGDVLGAKDALAHCGALPPLSQAI